MRHYAQSRPVGPCSLLLLLLTVRAAAFRSLVHPRGLGELGQEANANCDLCEYNWLFILSSGGRTGSTTALSMLNAIPGVELGGEHDGALLHLAQFFKKVKATQRHGGAAWYSHKQDYGAIKCELQQVLRHMLLGHDFAALEDSVRVRSRASLHPQEKTS